MSFTTYCPEMGDTTPTDTVGSATLSHYGKHYFIKTLLKLKGRGIVYEGENKYKVTILAFEKLCKVHHFSGKYYLD